MKLLKFTAFIIVLIGTLHILYGAFAIGIAYLNAADLPVKFSQQIGATGATWEEWRVSFIHGGTYRIVIGVIAIGAGVGISKKKNWARVTWLFLSPILLLSQFSEGQKSMTYFNSHAHYDLAFGLLIFVALTWAMLLAPVSRKPFARIA